MDTATTLLGATEAARAAFVSKQTLIRDVAAGLIAPIGKLSGPNGAYVFDAAEVERYAAARAS